MRKIYLPGLRVCKVLRSSTNLPPHMRKFSIKLANPGLYVPRFGLIGDGGYFCTLPHQISMN